MYVYIYISTCTFNENLFTLHIGKQYEKLSKLWRDEKEKTNMPLTLLLDTSKTQLVKVFYFTQKTILAQRFFGF